MVPTGSTRARLACVLVVADLAFTLASLCGCSGGDGGEPVVLPPTPIAMAEVPGRGLANPWSIVPSADGQTLLVQERATGSLARVDVASGAITRIDPPSASTGRTVALAADPADATSALVVLGSATEPVDPPLEPAMSGAVYRIGIASGGFEPVMESVFGGTGFFVDAAGTGAYTWLDGIDHVDFASGARERLDGCAGVTQVIGVDPLGQAAYSIGFYGGDGYTTPLETMGRCDLATGAQLGTSRDYRFESVSLACGARRVYRAQTDFTRYATDGSHTSLYEVFDSATFEPIGSLDPNERVSGLVAPGGRVATDSDCGRVWFGTPGGVFGYDDVHRSARRLVDGLAPIAAIAAGDLPGTVFVTGGASGSIGPRRVDLSSGDFAEIFEGGASVGEPLVGLAWAPGSNRVRVALSDVVRSHFPPYWSGTVRVDEIDPSTGAITEGVVLEGASASRVASCAGGERLFLLGARFDDDGYRVGSWLFEYRDGSVRPTRPMTQPDGEVVNIEGFPGNGRLAMSRNCDTAYVLGDKLYRAYTKGGEIREVPGTIGSAMVMDPRQDLLVVASDTNLYGLDLRNGAVQLLAGLREPVLDMAMTDDGAIAWTGATSVGLGVVDLVNGTSARLWEGAGTYGR